MKNNYLKNPGKKTIYAVISYLELYQQYNHRYINYIFVIPEKYSILNGNYLY